MSYQVRCSPTADVLGELIWINAARGRSVIFAGETGVRDHASRLVLASRDSVGGLRGGPLRRVPWGVPSGK
jgi:hypothetical protein